MSTFEQSFFVFIGLKASVTLLYLDLLFSASEKSVKVQSEITASPIALKGHELMVHVITYNDYKLAGVDLEKKLFGDFPF